MKTNIIFSAALCGLAGFLISACTVTGPKDGIGEGKDYQPTIEPSNFTDVVDNPYFPLIPGTTTITVEKEGSETRENKTVVTSGTKIIMGVRCVVVHDTVTRDGAMVEDTLDWYAQDNQGAVWYFGETTKEFKAGGRVSTAGSWEGGVNGAKPGIIMPARAVPGAAYRQEHSPGNAEDVGRIVSSGESVTVPAGTWPDCVKTRDWSLLESGHEFKWYAKGIGLVRTESSSGEIAVLTSIVKK